MAADIGLDHVASLTGEDGLAALDDKIAIGQRPRELEIRLDQQDRNAAPPPEIAG
jgi:hypothetical protein